MKLMQPFHGVLAKAGVLVLLLPLLAACGGGAAPGGASSSQPTETLAVVAAVSPPTATTGGPMTTGSGSTKIVWWHIQTAQNERDNWQKVASDYAKAHPDVSIEITVLENEAFKSKLATAMQSGHPPDLFQTWGGGALAEYANAGLVQDLTPELAKNGWGDSFFAGPLGLFKVGDKYYGVPWRIGMVGFWYNKALFQKAGIDAPPTTWAALLDDVKKLQAANITPIALGEKDSWTGAFYWEYLATRLGGKAAFDKAYTRTGSFADQPFVAAGARLKELVDLKPFETGFLGLAYTDHQALMANGKAAMELMGQWAPGSDRAVATDPKAYDANVAWFPFPAIEGGAGDPTDALGGGDGFAIGKTAPPATIDFVRYLTRLDLQKTMAAAGIAVPPVVKGAETALTDPLLKQVQQGAANAKYFQLYYDQYMPPAVGATVNEQTQALFAGTSTSDAVAKAIDASAASELKK